MTMRAGWMFAIAGCGFHPVAATALGDGDDAAIDTPVHVADALACYGGGLVTACPQVVPTGSLVLDTNQQIMTDTDVRCVVTPQLNGADLFASRSAPTVEVSAAITAVGARPLVLIATQALRSPLPARSTSRVILGAATADAGASTAALRGLGPAAGANGGGGGGGPGGSFGDLGGDGGDGNWATGRPPDQIGAGGTAAQIPSLAVVQGGCAGIDVGGAGGTGGAGGAGGGALYLIAGTQLVVDRLLAAGGAGGTQEV